MKTYIVTASTSYNIKPSDVEALSAEVHDSEEALHEAVRKHFGVSGRLYTAEEWQQAANAEAFGTAHEPPHYAVLAFAYVRAPRVLKQHFAKQAAEIIAEHAERVIVSAMDKAEG